MIDFTNCPTDKPWYLWDTEGNSKIIRTELEFTYARKIIAENQIEGYYLSRIDDPLGVKKYYINHYGVVYPYPDGLFDSGSQMSSEIIFSALKTREKETGESYEEKF